MANLKQLMMLEAIGKAAANDPASKKKLSALKENILNNIEREARKRKRTTNNNTYYRNENIYRNSSGRVRSIPEPTPYYNQSLRRFLYKPSIGFYIILGLNRDGKAIKKRVPGQFYYRYDEKLARIVPFHRRGRIGPVPYRKSFKEREEERRRERERARHRNNNNNRNAKRRSAN
jgi:hypothetical protein